MMQKEERQLNWSMKVETYYRGCNIRSCGRDDKCDIRNSEWMARWFRFSHWGFQESHTLHIMPNFPETTDQENECYESGWGCCWILYISNNKLHWKIFIWRSHQPSLKIFKGGIYQAAENYVWQGSLTKKIFLLE